MEKYTEYWEDLKMTAVFVKEELSFEFEIFEWRGWNEKPKLVVDYAKKGAQSYDDITENLDEAQTLIRGLIKWDACSHLYFGDEDGYIHTHDKSGFDDLGEVLKRVFAESAKHLLKPHTKEYFS